MDLASAGPIVVPEFGLVLGAGKDSILYSLDWRKMGKPSRADLQNDPAGNYGRLKTEPVWFGFFPGFGVSAAPNDPKQLNKLFFNKTHHQHGSPIYWPEKKLMEPPSAAARIVDGNCEVWAPTQAPQATRENVAKRLGLPVDKVTVHVTLLGGGFGRKSKPDFATEAAFLSQQMGGRPVKVVWTRDDDLHHDYFHTVSVEHLQAGLDAQGKTTACVAEDRCAGTSRALAVRRPRDHRRHLLRDGFRRRPCLRERGVRGNDACTAA